MKNLSLTEFTVHTIDGFKNVYIGPKGGKYIKFKNEYISLKKLPEYVILLNSGAETKSIPQPQPQPQTKLNKFQEVANKVTSKLSNLKPSFKKDFNDRGFFYAYENFESKIENYWSKHPEIVEAIKHGLAAIEHESEYPVNNIKFENVTSRDQVLEYIKFKTKQTFEDVI
jgi:hypothetical protein